MSTHKRITCASVNMELRKRGIAERLVRGKDYFYFTEGDAHKWPSSSVYVAHVDSFTVEQWIDEHKELKEASRRSGWL